MIKPADQEIVPGDTAMKKQSQSSVAAKKPPRPGRTSRMEDAGEKGEKPDRAEKEAVLKARAKAMAAAAEDERDDGSILEVVEFSINEEKYGVESVHIHEVFPLKELTEIPGVPDFVLGVVNVRGQIVSVIDIRKFFDMPEKGFSDLNRIIILRSATMEFGILADEVLGVRRIPQAETLSTLPTLTGVRQEYLKAVSKDRTVILDGMKLLSDSTIVIG